MLDSGLVAYVKCVLVGLITGIGTILIRAVAELVVPITRMMLKSDSAYTAGGGLLFAESFASLADLILPWTVGFVIGFALMLRRQRRLARIRCQ
jgi:hypothetical protein